MADPEELKELMAGLIAQEIQRLAGDADLVVHTLYDPQAPDDPLDYDLVERGTGDAPLSIGVDFDFEGAALWYFCERDGDAFRAKKILIQIRDGRFVQGQVGDFEGFWDEFPQYIAEDRWVRSAILKQGANDAGMPKESADAHAGRRLAAAE